MKTLIKTLLMTSVLTFTAYAKDGGRNNNTTPEINSACNLASAENRYWHSDVANHPYKKITCDFKEYLKIDSKGPHCGTYTQARVIYFENCTTNGSSAARPDIAITTYFPGWGCWNNQEISDLDSLGFDILRVGTKVSIIEGEWSGMGKGTGVVVANDIHQISIANRDFCPTEHSMIPHVMMSTSPEHSWLRESF